LKRGAAGNEKVKQTSNGDQQILPEACLVTSFFRHLEPTYHAHGIPNLRAPRTSSSPGTTEWLGRGEVEMRSVTMQEAKTRLIEEALEGEEVVISRGAVPVARLAPIGEIKGRRLPGTLRGKLKVGPEFAEPPQAQAEGLPVITNDAVFKAYGARRIW
jgi:antitoxin (DNA-binding transcriptional repressor) of toxin-antitoxin stability system